MTDRDRLKQEIEKALDKRLHQHLAITSDYLADELIANGVSISPIPIGSTVYEIRARGRRTILYSSRKCDYGIVNDCYFKNAIAHNLEIYVKEKAFVKSDWSRWDKTIFETKEKAQAEIERWVNND